MGDIILGIMAVVYVLACVFVCRDRDSGKQQLAEEDIAVLEQMLKDYIAELD